MSRFRGWVAIAILVGAVGACGPFCGNGKFNLSNAHIQSTQTCPPNSSNFGYRTPVTIDVSNETSQTVTIKRVDSDATTTATHGAWNAPVGTKGGETNVPFSPKSFTAGQKGTVTLSLDWTCTNSGAGASTYADFQVVVSFQTSAGTYKIGLNKTRMVMG